MLFRSAEFITQGGKLFNGVIQARRGQDNLIRISVTESVDAVPVHPQPSKESAAGVQDPKNYLFNQLILPVATIGPDYRFEEVNDAFCELSGYSKTELKAIKFIHLLHEEDQQRESKILSNLFSGKIPFNRSEKRILRKDRRLVWVNMSSSLIRDEKGFPQFVVSMIENISQQKRYERSLINDKMKLSTVVDSADLYVVNVDRNHSILFINEKLKGEIGRAHV